MENEVMNNVTEEIVEVAEAVPAKRGYLKIGGLLAIGTTLAYAAYRFVGKPVVQKLKMWKQQKQHDFVVIEDDPENPETIDK